MTCADFEKILPDVVEGVRSINRNPVKSCPSCLDLVGPDLELIFREARQLEGLYEPSPRVWNSIEATLRQEGIIRAPKPALVPPFRRSSASAWIMAPAVAVILLAVGLFYQRQSRLQTAIPSGEVISATLRADNNRPVRPRGEGEEDHGLFQTSELPYPAVRATYEANLKDVNAYIEENTSEASPGRILPMRKHSSP